MLRRFLPPSGERSVTDSVSEPVRRHVRRVMARFRAYRRVRRKQIIQAGSHDSAVKRIRWASAGFNGRPDRSQGQGLPLGSFHPSRLARARG